MSEFLLSLLVNPVWKWLHRLGGPGLILLGVADNSAVPLPGSMDVFVVILASHRREWWFYYAAMATVGAVLGGYLTYRLAAKGGERTLENKLGKQRVKRVYQRFKKRGFVTVFIGAILPPPFPVVPFLMAAGVLKYPPRNFLSALALGRAIRFFALAYIAHIYGRSILGFFNRYYEPLLYALIALAVLGGVVALSYFLWYRPKVQDEERKRGQEPEDFPIPGHHQEGKARARKHHRTA